MAMSRQAEEVDKMISKCIILFVFPALLSHNPVLLNQAQLGNHPYPITPHYYLSEMVLERDVQVLVTQHHFDLALSQLKPSVTESEMQHYAHVQRLFSNDTASRKHEGLE